MYPAIKKGINKVWESRSNYQHKKKLKKIIRSTNQLIPDFPVSLAFEYKKKWSSLGNNVSCFYPRVFSSVNGIFSLDYVPENIYYNKIEPVLNNKSYASAYSDKNFYEKFLPEFKSIFPATFIRGINGILYDRDYKRLDHVLPNDAQFRMASEFILKPATETSGGANVKAVYRRNEAFIVNDIPYAPKQFLHFLASEYNSSFVLQERLGQSEWFNEFNPTSVNTIRIFTYRSVKDECVHPLHALIRFGQSGSIVDNQAAGGFSCGISAKGLLNDFAVNKYGYKNTSIQTVVEKSGQPVPGFNEMKALAVKIAGRFYYHRFLAFDFCRDEKDSVRLLEINFKNIETNFHQMNTGPLLDRFTEEIIDYCRNNRKTMVFDFKV